MPKEKLRRVKQVKLPTIVGGAIISGETSTGINVRSKSVMTGSKNNPHHVMAKKLNENRNFNSGLGTYETTTRN